MDISEQLKKMREDLYEDTQATVDGLIAKKEEMKKLINQRIAELMETNGYFKKIVVPKASFTLWKTHKTKLSVPINWRYIVSIPFIYGMLVPAIIFHAGVEIYQQVCFRLYGIPLVNAGDYFVMDRKLMTMLNFWEKINCIYCSYVNNLIRYASEIGGRTERYWCPIKYYRKVGNAHSQYEKFIGEKQTDQKHLKSQWKELRDFSDIKQ